MLLDHVRVHAQAQWQHIRYTKSMFIYALGKSYYTTHATAVMYMADMYILSHITEQGMRLQFHDNHLFN